MRISAPAPELPVPDVQAAQAWYRDRLGFEIAWFNADGRIGAVSHGDCAIFFRETPDHLTPAVFWIFVDDVDAAYAELAARNAPIEAPPEDMPWGLRQFTLVDLHGNRFYLHHDL